MCGSSRRQTNDRLKWLDFFFLLSYCVMRIYHQWCYSRFDCCVCLVFPGYLVISASATGRVSNSEALVWQRTNNDDVSSSSYGYARAVSTYCLIHGLAALAIGSARRISAHEDWLFGSYLGTELKKLFRNNNDVDHHLTHASTKLY